MTFFSGGNYRLLTSCAGIGLPVSSWVARVCQCHTGTGTSCVSQLKLHVSFWHRWSQQSGLNWNCLRVPSSAWSSHLLLSLPLHYAFSAFTHTLCPAELAPNMSFHSRWIQVSLLDCCRSRMCCAQCLL